MLRAAVRDTKGIFFAQILHQVCRKIMRNTPCLTRYGCKTSQIIARVETDLAAGGWLAFNLVHGVLSPGKLK